jgi:hypothetical protein
MKIMIKTLLVACVLVLALSAVRPASTQQPVALVMKLEGGWTVDAQPAKVGMPLRLGSDLRRSDSQESGAVRIDYVSGRDEACIGKAGESCAELRVHAETH